MWAICLFTDVFVSLIHIRHISGDVLYGAKDLLNLVHRGDEGSKTKFCLLRVSVRELNQVFMQYTHYLIMINVYFS